jgi:hypothetical protein
MALRRAASVAELESPTLARKKPRTLADARRKQRRGGRRASPSTSVESKQQLSEADVYV